MLELGMPIDITNEFGNTAFMLATSYNRTDVLRCLIEKGENVNQQTRYTRWTALHIASYKNHTDVIKILLQYGARTDIKNIKGRTPIDLARDRNNEEAVALLQQL